MSGSAIPSFLREKTKQRSAKVIITDLLAGGWNVAGFLASVAGAVETGVAIGGASVSARFGLYTLPITAFLFGTWVREKMDAADERDVQSRNVIMMLAVDYAIEQHLQRYPNSRLRDASFPLGIRIPSSMTSIIQRWSSTYNQRYKNLLPEIKMVQFMGQKWNEFVMDRFNKISSDFALLLEQAETEAAKPIRSGPPQPIRSGP